MKSLMLLWQEVLKELGTWCCTSTTLDLKKAKSRFEHEGLSFFTITLPAFGSDLQKGLEEGKVGRDLFPGFQRKGGLPLFLGGFLDRVFDRGTGRLLDEPCIDSIFAMRQLTLMLAKIGLPCSKERVDRAILGYLKCEKELKENDERQTSEDCEAFKTVANLLFQDVFQNVNNLVDVFGFVPGHGPGATADRLTGNGKFDQRVWPDRMEHVFPYGKYATPNERFSYLSDQAQFLEPGAEIPVRVITVPKTLKTPRIIAIEPTAMQYVQQGIMHELVPRIEDDNVIGGMIGFTHQDPNQVLAKEGSEKGELATLDLSEASDRVSNQHVRWMLSWYPELLEAVDACRSRKADVPMPNGTVQTIRLAKFASMGSALCFPFEAMVFLTLIFMGIQKQLNRRLSVEDVKSFHGQVRVYGDDLIIPVDYVRSVLDVLSTFGYKVNVDKSYWNGKFRESCGKDYYDGHDVTPVRVRSLFPVERTDVSEVISLVSLRNQLYMRGLWRTTNWLDNMIVRVLPHFPVVLPSSPVLGRTSFLGYETQKMDRYLHSPLVKGYVVTSRAPASPVSGEGALLKWFLKRGDEPFADRDHLERQGRPDAVNIKLRLASPF